MFIILTVLIFQLIIISHEMGHFLVGKIFKVEIKEFSIGFGPLVFGRRRKETKYSLRLFPLGGYVYFNDDEFLKKSIFKRFFIFLAGPFFNLLFAFVCVCLILFMQGKYTSLEIASVNSSVCCLKAGDEIKKVNGHFVVSSDDFIYEMARVPLSEPINLVVKRYGEDVKLFDVAKFNEKNEKRQIGAVLKVKNLDFFSFFRQGVSVFVFIIKLILTSFFDLFKGRLSFKDVSGPVGIISSLKQAAKIGVYSVFYLSAFLSVNIGIFNLVPLPALDGGQILLLLVEFFKRSPIKKSIICLLNKISFILIIFVFVVVLIKDFFVVFSKF